MKDLIKIIKQFKKNKSALEVGLTMVLKIALTVIAGVLFIWFVVMMMR